MKARRFLVIVIGLLIVVEMAATVLLTEEFKWNEGAAPLFILAMGVVGGILGFRKSEHAIGWLLLIPSLLMATGALGITYAHAALIWRPGSLPIGPWVIWVSGWGFGLGAGIPATFLFLLFPTGRLLSDRWKPVAWLAGLGLVWLLVSITFSSENFSEFPMSNPIALDASNALSAVLGVGFIVFLAGVIASVASVVVRFIRSTGSERQQLKWVVFGMVIAGGGAIVGSTGISSEIGNLVVVGSLALVPVAIGLAVFRYRLYDIDRLISRTVSYVLVVGLLGSAFAAGVVLVPNVLPGLEDSPVLVAASTLAVAALFNPLRRRIHRLVDRRFNRSRYDAEQVMEAFAGSLRSKVGLDGVIGGWVSVISDTMQPATASVWVKKTDSNA